MGMSGQNTFCASKEAGFDITNTKFVRKKMVNCDGDFVQWKLRFWAVYILFSWFIFVGIWLLNEGRRVGNGK